MATSSDTPTSLGSFESAFAEFIGAIRRARGRAERERTGGLTLSQYSVIEPLLETCPQPVGELAAAAGIAAPSATRIVDCLERSGIVTREHPPEDRRVVGVRLTAKGRRAALARRDDMVSKQRALYEALPAEDREQTIRLLRHIAGMMDEL